MYMYMYVLLHVYNIMLLCVQVLTWLEANCRVAIERAGNRDPLIAEQRAKYVWDYWTCIVAVCVTVCVCVCVC